MPVLREGWIASFGGGDPVDRHSCSVARGTYAYLRRWEFLSVVVFWSVCGLLFAARLRIHFDLGQTCRVRLFVNNAMSDSRTVEQDDNSSASGINIINHSSHY
jgi:hypothetical protein